MSDVTAQMTGDWKRAATLLGGLSRSMRFAASQTLGRMGLQYKGQVQRGIVSQAPGGLPYTPLKKQTIKRKGSSKALINHGDLVGGVSFKVTKWPRQRLFVGWLKQSMNRDGIPMANIGEVMEYGTIDGRIPARPTMGPISNSNSIRRRVNRDAQAYFNRLMRRRARGGSL